MACVCVEGIDALKDVDAIHSKMNQLGTEYDDLMDFKEQKIPKIHDTNIKINKPSVHQIRL